MKIRILFPFVLLAAMRCSAEDSALPIHLYRGYLIVTKCSIAGVPDLTAVIDTGVSETVLDSGLVKRLSLTVSKTGDVALFLDHLSSVDTVLIPSIHLGPILVENLRGIATGLSGLTAELGIRTDIIIGMDVLHRESFVIDYQRHRLTFGRPLPMRWSAKLNENVRFATLDAMVMGKKLRLQVDSGSSSLLVFGRRFGPVTGTALASPDIAVASVARTVNATAVDPAEIQVGNWHTYRGTVLFSGTSNPASDFQGLLGLWTLRPRRVAFDFAQTMLYWE